MKKIVFLVLSVVLVGTLLLTGMALSACSTTTTTQTTTTQLLTTTTQLTTTQTTTTQLTTTLINPTSTVTSTTPTGPKYGGILTVAEPIFPGQPLGYPPERGFAEVIFQQPCLEPLLVESIDGTFSPRLATDWKVAPDGSSITFTLRQGVKFHDGTDFNADAVKWNFDQEIPTGHPSTVNWASVDVIDDHTVRVNLKKYTNSELSDFAFGGGNYIISPTAFAKNGLAWVEANMVGTGPFQEVGYQRDVQVVYKKFDNYWGKDDQGNKLPYLDGIIYKAVPDPMTQIAALKSGELDGMASGADKNLSDLVKSGLVAVTGTLGVGGYFPDSADTSSPLANEKVREALEYAIDKDAIAQAFSYGFWGPAYQYAPPSSAAYDSSLPNKTYNPDKAKQLLADAGYPNGFEFNFLVTNDEPAKSISQAVQSQWADIGVKADIQILESAKFEEYGRTGWSGLLYGAPTGPASWHSTLQGVLSPTKSAYVSVDIPQEYIDLWNAAATSLQYDPAKEKALVDYVTNNEMCIPVWNVVRAWVTQPYVKDGGFLSMASGFFWRPDKIWLDK